MVGKFKKIILRVKEKLIFIKKFDKREIFSSVYNDEGNVE
jgi:hypothetical protein